MTKQKSNGRPYDFKGYATVYEVPCSDGRTIEHGAFEHQIGQTVPLVWQHQHGDMTNVLGHVLLVEAPTPPGVLAHGYFNNSREGARARTLVQDGDVDSLSIWANQVIEHSEGGTKRVKRGQIREVSLVLTGANPGAKIFDVVRHSDDPYSPEEVVLDGVIVHSGQPIEKYVVHEDPEPEPESSELTLNDIIADLTPEKQKLFVATIGQALTTEDILADADEEDGNSLASVYETLTEQERNVLNYLVGELSDETDDSPEESEEESQPTIQQGDLEVMNTMNIFETNGEQTNVLSHSDVANVLAAARQTRPDSLRQFLAERDIVIAHSITNSDILLPVAKDVATGGPAWWSREMAWVEGVLMSTNRRPFSRVRSRTADLTADEARAKGYVTGNQKVEEVISVAQRETSPQTVYKLQKLDRDFILDVTDFDVVAWLKEEMRVMLKEEIARAILIGDGRSAISDDKIKEANIRPVFSDDDFYTVKKVYNDVGNEKTLAEFTDAELIDLIDWIAEARVEYRGSGSPTFYTSPETLTRLLMVRDTIGRRLYGTEAELASALRVSKIVEVPVMAGFGLEDEVDPAGLPSGTYDIAHLGVIVNLRDYVIGMDRGGETNFFDDFDINFNKYTYLYETRMSGALVQPKSAIAVSLVTAKSA